MRLYLGTFSGAGTDLDPFRPLVPGDFSILDLRGDVTQPAGRCLIAVPTVLPTVPAGWRDLGDNLDGRLPAVGRTRIANDLGLTLAADTPRGIIAELLIVHGTAPTDRTRWNKLQADRDGRNRIVMLGETIFDASAIVGAVIADTFNRADADALGSSSEGWSWTETLGDVDIVSNLAQVQTVNATAAGRAEIDLASANHYVQAVIAAWEGGTGSNFVAVGVVARYSASVLTNYLGRYETDLDRYELYRFVTGTATLIATQAQTQPTPPFTIRLEVNGSALGVFQDSVSKLASTDTNITGNLRTGYLCFQGSTHQAPLTSYNNFEAGDLAGGTAHTRTVSTTTVSTLVDA